VNARGDEFAAALARWPWRAIRDCPGRYALTPADADSTPERILGYRARSKEHRSAVARDRVVLTPFAAAGGLISYRRDDGGWLHTLNDADGWARKLAQLGLDEV